MPTHPHTHTPTRPHTHTPLRQHSPCIRHAHHLPSPAPTHPALTLLCLLLVLSPHCPRPLCPYPTPCAHTPYRQVEATIERYHSKQHEAAAKAQAARSQETVTRLGEALALAEQRCDRLRRR